MNGRHHSARVPHTRRRQAPWPLPDSLVLAGAPRSDLDGVVVIPQHDLAVFVWSVEAEATDLACVVVPNMIQTLIDPFTSNALRLLPLTLSDGAPVSGWPDHALVRQGMVLITALHPRTLARISNSRPTTPILSPTHVHSPHAARASRPCRRSACVVAESVRARPSPTASRSHGRLSGLPSSRNRTGSARRRESSPGYPGRI